MLKPVVFNVLTSRFNINKFYVFQRTCISLICMLVRVNKVYFLKQNSSLDVTQEKK
jgi:hypothetical protein